MRFLSYIAFWCIFTVVCYGDSVVIYNDSPFPLEATIMSASGKTLKTVSVNPQQQSTWSDPSPANAVYSQTPYTVIFKCRTGGQFGIASGISQGAWVTAMQSSGSHYCKPKKEDKDEQKKGQQGQQKQQQALQSVPPNQQKSLNLGPP